MIGPEVVDTTNLSIIYIHNDVGHANHSKRAGFWIIHGSAIDKTKEYNNY